MKKTILTACLCMLLAAPACAEDLRATMTTLDISAEASMKVSPDIATITTGVVTVDAKSDKAMELNTAKMNNVFKVLEAAGIARKDIQTSGFSLSPQYEYRPNKPAVIGTYRAANNVNITVHDLKNIGPVIDSLVAEGSNQIDGPQFSVKDTDAALDKVRTEAVAKARKRAQLYADAAGLKIKRIISISEQTGYTPPPRPMMMKAMAEDSSATSTPVAEGEVNLSVTVNIQFELTS